MKYTYLLLIFTLLFSSCVGKEELIEPPTPIITSFTWKIDGESYSDNSVDIAINSSDVLTIDASDNSVDVRIIIYNFSSKVDGEEVQLNNLTDKAYVTKNGVSHTDTQNGKFTFSKIKEKKLTGTFNFKSRELVNFQSVTVTDGQFTNVSY